ncbi:transcriptional regulator [Streptomyces niveus]|uniref:transcriptional regulator n=1 Tax=Streptomyces niveus TaxID=193462 RepID=UPI00386347FD|nr:transcriptional regulator [Streptomyces niveus]
MPRSNNDRAPVHYIGEGAWPQVSLVPEAPLSAHCGLLLARNLHEVIGEEGLSLRRFAEVAAVAHSTVFRVLNGNVLPDVGTLARLECAVNRQLWPSPAAVRASTHSTCH